MNTDLEALEKKLGIVFLNKSLLTQALTHSSYAHEVKRSDVIDNERLEFLGDAILKLVISEYLFNKFPTLKEGDLTKIRAGVISDETLATIAKKLHIGPHLLLSSNERKAGGTERKSNLANAFEAILGAIYLDSGVGRARDFILDYLKDEIEKASRAGYIRDYKSALQEFVQKYKWGLPFYRVTREVGPKHKKIFYVEVKIKNRIYGHGKGLSKKEAEQGAARFAFQRLKRELRVRRGRTAS